MKAFINFLNLQIVWFAVILGVAQSLIWPACVAVAGSLMWQFWPGNRHPLDGRALGICVLLGLILDSVWAISGLVEYRMHWPHPMLSPAWIMLLWIAFALTFNHSFKWMHAHPTLASVVGAVAWPMGYVAGERLGAVSLPEPWLAAGLMAISWLIIVQIMRVALNPNQVESPSSDGATLART